MRPYIILSSVATANISPIQAQKLRQRLIVRDGNESKLYEAIGDIKWGPDGEHFAFTGTGPNKKTLVVHDGTEGNAYDFIYNLTFSLDGKHLAYSARRDGKFLVVRDGKEGAVYEQVKELAFSPDSGHLSYLGRQGTNWVAVLDETATQPYSHILNPRWKDNGALDFFAVRDEQIYRVSATPK